MRKIASNRILFVLLFALASTAQAQLRNTQPSGAQRATTQAPRGAAAGGTAASQGAQTVSPALWKLLNDWSAGSAKIDYLHGRVERHTYNVPFKQDKFAECKLWFGAPDKGRLDVHAVQITPKMIEERKTAKGVQRDAQGNPFKLVSDEARRWLCDGERVYQINDKEKTAEIMILAPEQRGRNIMNSSLPFLFGMPPKDALKRFKISIQKDERPASPFVYLAVLPLTRKDSELWKRALIILDTRTWLPNAVKLYDPTDAPTVYRFLDMKTGKSLIGKVFGENPWDPKLGRDYVTNVLRPGDKKVAGQSPANMPQRNNPVTADARSARPANPGNVLPNFVGKSHKVATETLVALGIPKERIRITNAGPAPRANLQFLVRGQEPVANTPLNKTATVTLMVFDRPAAVQNVSGQQ